MKRSPDKLIARSTEAVAYLCQDHFVNTIAQRANVGQCDHIPALHARQQLPAESAEWGRFHEAVIQDIGVKKTELSVGNVKRHGYMFSAANSGAEAMACESAGSRPTITGDNRSSVFITADEGTGSICNASGAPTGTSTVSSGTNTLPSKWARIDIMLQVYANQPISAIMLQENHKVWSQGEGHIFSHNLVRKMPVSTEEWTSLRTP